MANYDADTTETVFIVFGAFLVCSYAATALFLLGIFVPKLTRELEEVMDGFARNWIQLQTLTALAYLNLKYTYSSATIIHANHSWVFINYADKDIKNSISQPETINYPDYFFATDEWEPYYFYNVFTVICIVGGYILAYVASKFIWKRTYDKNILTKIMEFEVGLQILKIVHFRLVMSFFLDLKEILDGKTIDFNSGLSFGVSIALLAVYPIGKILYLRIKHRANLEASKIKKIFGADYRAYRYFIREFHLIFEQFENIGIAASLCMIGEYKDIQLILVVTLHAAMLVYIGVFRPFRVFRTNLEDIAQRLIKTALAGVLVIYHFIDQKDFLENGVIALLIIWYLTKLLFTFLHIKELMSSVKTLLDQAPIDELEIEEQPKAFKKKRKSRKEVSLAKLNSRSDSEEETGKKKNGKKNNYNDVITTGRDRGEEDFTRDISEDESPKKTKKNHDGNHMRKLSSTEEEDIDPRLVRKRTPKRRRQSRK
ncbi:unnamed protein product [Blepharisma stoltei]|uniref:Uncharacterized protein n=1 Tax=Blepharisma stoltei TaxID=1481888 RepID=A0AAU9JSQ9_9CILI|nr:unnamed protein product [Blepharisma stoltei]